MRVDAKGVCPSERMVCAYADGKWQEVYVTFDSVGGTTNVNFIYIPSNTNITVRKQFFCGVTSSGHPDCIPYVFGHHFYSILHLIRIVVSVVTLLTLLVLPTLHPECRLDLVTPSLTNIRRCTLTCARADAGRDVGVGPRAGRVGAARARAARAASLHRPDDAGRRRRTAPHTGQSEGLGRLPSSVLSNRTRLCKKRHRSAQTNTNYTQTRKRNMSIYFDL